MCRCWRLLVTYGLMYVRSGYRWWVGRCYVEEVSFDIKAALSHENHDSCNYFVLMESFLIECCV